jgi:hypothetical protein
LVNHALRMCLQFEEKNKKRKEEREEKSLLKRLAHMAKEVVGEAEKPRLVKCNGGGVWKMQSPLQWRIK